jgi:hypothetical protein
MRARFVVASIVALLCALPALAPAAVLRTYFTGNSMTDGINYGGLDAIANAKGNDLVYGKHTNVGSTIYGIWSRPTQGYNLSPYGYYATALKNNTWDGLVVTPTDRKLYVQFSPTGPEEGDVTNTLNLLNYARTKSPNIQLYVYERTPRRTKNADGTFQPLDLPAIWGQKFQNSTTPPEISWNARWGRDYYQQLVKEVRAKQPAGSKPAQIVPVGEVVYEIDQRIRKGTFPTALKRIDDIFMDASHFNQTGSYIAAVTFYSIMYKKDPRSLTVPGQFGAINSTLAGAIRSAVWDVVRREPYSPLYVPPVARGVSVVPEPAAALALFAVPALLLRRRRA